MDYLVHITFTWPPGITPEEQQRLIAAEHTRARELAATGNLERLWRIPGQRANWGIWHAADATELHAAIASLPHASPACAPPSGTSRLTARWASPRRSTSFNSPSLPFP